MWEKVKTSNGPKTVTAAVISEYAAFSISTPAPAIFLSAGVDIPAVRRTWMAKSTSLRARLLPISDMMFSASVDCEHSAYWMEPGKLQEMNICTRRKDSKKLKPTLSRLNQWLSSATYQPKKGDTKATQSQEKNLTVANLLTKLLGHKMGSQQASLKNSWNMLQDDPTLISISKLLCLLHVASAFITVHLQSDSGSTLPATEHPAKLKIVYIRCYLLYLKCKKQMRKSNYHISLHGGKSLIMLVARNPWHNGPPCWFVMEQSKLY